MGNTGPKPKPLPPQSTPVAASNPPSPPAAPAFQSSSPAAAPWQSPAGSQYPGHNPAALAPPYPGAPPHHNYPPHIPGTPGGGSYGPVPPYNYPPRDAGYGPDSFYSYQRYDDPYMSAYRSPDYADPYRPVTPGYGGYGEYGNFGSSGFGRYRGEVISVDYIRHPPGWVPPAPFVDGGHPAQGWGPWPAQYASDRY